MSIGRFWHGQSVPLFLVCRGGSGHQAWPDDCPVAKVWSPLGQVEHRPMVVQNPYDDLGIFALPLRIDQSYSAGHHAVLYTYAVDSVARVETDSFEVVPGGDPVGSVIALHSVKLPESVCIFAQVDSGRILFGRNPTF